MSDEPDVAALNPRINELKAQLATPDVYFDKSKSEDVRSQIRCLKKEIKEIEAGQERRRELHAQGYIDDHQANIDRLEKEMQTIDKNAHPDKFDALNAELSSEIKERDEWVSNLGMKERLAALHKRMWGE
jgi:multidrug resistance efflux pump